MATPQPPNQGPGTATQTASNPGPVPNPKAKASRSRGYKHSPSNAGPGTGHKPASGQAAKPRLSQQQAVRNKTQLQAYIRANGNMSVARRTAVVGGSLEQMGYTREQADTIALDAPLNASMYNEQAIDTALEYASSLDALPDTDKDHITMPLSAKRRYQAYLAKKQPIQQFRSRIGSSTSKRVGYFTRRLLPLRNKVANAPVPGGLGSLFALNLLFLAVIIPANAQGYTRMQLLWYTLMNQTKFTNHQEKQEIVPPSPMVQAAFGAATGIESAALAIASLGQNAQQTINQLQNPGQAVDSSIGNIPVVGGLWRIGTGQLASDRVAPPPSGNNPPPPPPSPTTTL